MAYTSQDGAQPFKRKTKRRGLIKITHEMMAQGILGLPEGIEIIDVYSDPRDIVHFRLRSDKPSKGIFEIGEAMESVQGFDIENLLMKKAIRTVKALEAKEEGDYLYKEYQKALAEVEAEDGLHD